MIIPRIAGNPVVFVHAAGNQQPSLRGLSWIPSSVRNVAKRRTSLSFLTAEIGRTGSIRTAISAIALLPVSGCAKIGNGHLPHDESTSLGVAVLSMPRNAFSDKNTSVIAFCTTAMALWLVRAAVRIRSSFSHLTTLTTTARPIVRKRMSVTETVEKVTAMARTFVATPCIDCLLTTATLTLAYRCFASTVTKVNESMGECVPTSLRKVQRLERQLVHRKPMAMEARDRQHTKYPLSDDIVCTVGRPTAVRESVYGQTLAMLAEHNGFKVDKSPAIPSSLELSGRVAPTVSDGRWKHGVNCRNVRLPHGKDNLQRSPDNRERSETIPSGSTPEAIAGGSAPHLARGEEIVRSRWSTTSCRIVATAVTVAGYSERQGPQQRRHPPGQPRMLG